ncbi:MAG: rod shape-determining protein MreC [Oleiphilaceae bacterium]
MAVILSVILIFIDVRTSQLNSVRNIISSALAPVQWLSDVPNSIAFGIEQIFTSRESLEGELELMKDRMLVLQRKSQKLASVTAELNRLRELLNASRVLDEGVVVAELIGASPDPDNQYILINKGFQDGVYIGQAILDSDGLMGQVIEINEFSSRVLLVSDSRHAVPVQVNRNGMRAIAYGVGSLSFLELGNVPDTADIQVGDLLVSSGLGGRFPEGYPVARVSSIEHDSGRSFAQVKITPEAKLNRSRLLLLVFKPSDQVPALVIPDEKEEVQRVD